LIRLHDLYRRLKEKGYKRIALQAPEGLKRKLPTIASDLRSQGFDVIISGDPCYGACDLDLCARDNADVLVHIGHTPVDHTERVLYEPWKVDAALDVIHDVIPLLSGSKAGLVTTVQHAHLLPAAAQILHQAGIEAIIAEASPRTPLRGQVLGCSFDGARKTGEKEIIFLGTGLFHPIGIRLATSARVFACDPITREINEPDADRLLRIRFALIEKARKAESFGILVSEKTGQCRIETAEKLCSLSPRAYIVMIREVTPDQLLNLGFQCFVNTACPRLAYDDQTRFPVPVLTPAEFEILCGIREFEDYEIDEIL